MMPLRECQIAVAAPRADAATLPRVEALRRAGALVRVCVLSQNLWSALTETAFDLIVVLADDNDVESLAVYQQLQRDPRTRGIPALLVTDALGSAAQRGAIVLSARADEQVFVELAADLVVPMRRLREAEQRERSLRDDMRGELQRQSRSAQQFSDLNHELRSMFGAIMGFSCNLRDELAGPLSADQRSHVFGILSAVERATKLLETHPIEIVPSARPSAASASGSPPRAQRSMVHLARIASEVTALFGGVALQKAMRLHCHSDESVCVWGDALQLKQVLTNLVINALKYTPVGGEIRVRVRWSRPTGRSGVHSRRAAELSVEDTGPGIPVEYRQRIFERGFRITERVQVAGDGIGLSVVQDLVTQHGGSVKVEGDPGSGALFTALLPQDRRQRAPEGALILSDGSAARSLLRMLEAKDPQASWLVTPEEKERFVQLASACRSAILLAQGEDLHAALAKLPQASGTDEGQFE
jgi:signal transduction histidine kinase